VHACLTTLAKTENSRKRERATAQTGHGQTPHAAYKYTTHKKHTHTHTNTLTHVHPHTPTVSVQTHNYLDVKIAVPTL